MNYLFIFGLKFFVLDFFLERKAYVFRPFISIEYQLACFGDGKLSR